MRKSLGMLRLLIFNQLFQKYLTEFLCHSTSSSSLLFLVEVILLSKTPITR